jgi:hypothetical protein
MQKSTEVRPQKPNLDKPEKLFATEITENTEGNKNLKYLITAF